MMDTLALEKENNLTRHYHKNTIMPRFTYCLDLLDMVLDELDKKRTDLRNQNLGLYDKYDNDFDFDFKKRIELESDVCIALESLWQIQQMMHSVSDIGSITTLLSSTTSIIRMISSRLFSSFPNYSQSLCELSAILGSVVMDSATITEAKFDFAESNKASQRILDEAKLIVDSKINKQYPNLDFAKPELA